MSSTLSICLVNRNYPPKNGATGYFARRLISSLKIHTDYKIKVITVGSKRDTTEISYVSSQYDGKVKWRRLFSTYFESRRLIKKAKLEDADVYIIMTDPPFLNYWASKLLKDRKWILWSMDIYPEAFAANNLINPKNVFYKHYQSTLKNYSPNFIIALGDAQLEYLRKHYYKPVDGLTIPIGLRDEKEITNDDHRPSTNDKIIFGYIGTIGEAHDAEAIISLAKELKENDHLFVLSCKGAKEAYLNAQLRDLNHVLIKKDISEVELAIIDIHVVSLNDKWTHICVPSKAISAIQKGRPVLFLGSDRSDTWQLINEAGWRLTKEYDILEFLKDLNHERLSIKTNKAKNLASRLKKQYDDGVRILINRIEEL